MKGWILGIVVFLSGLSVCSAADRMAGDSVAIETWLKQAADLKIPSGQYPLFFAQKLIGKPYVASTLEINKQERLVINVRELDCTTLVENAVAMTLTARKGKRDFGTFKYYLEKIRYDGGRCNGYASRNHYFSEWIESNSKQNLVEEIGGKPFTGRQVINVYYMSKYPDKYPMLKGNKSDQIKIRKNEQSINQKVVSYIPSSKLNGGKAELGMVHDGDIIALVTKKAGLDISHVGFAVWGKDGKLHLLNASSLHKKVVLEPMTLYTYMKKHPSNLGIRVIRIK